MGTIAILWVLVIVCVGDSIQLPSFHPYEIKPAINIFTNIYLFILHYLS